MSGKFRERALRAGGGIVEAEILKKLQQTLLAASSRQKRLDGRARAEKPIHGKLQDAVGCQAGKPFIEMEDLPFQAGILCCLRYGKGEGKDDINNGVPGTSATNQGDGFFADGAEAVMAGPEWIVQRAKEFFQIPVDYLQGIATLDGRRKCFDERGVLAQQRAHGGETAVRKILGSKS